MQSKQNTFLDQLKLLCQQEDDLRLNIGNQFHIFEKAIDEIINSQELNKENIDILIKLVSILGFPATIEMEKLFKYLSETKSKLQQNEIYYLTKLFSALCTQLESFITWNSQFLPWVNLQQYFQTILKNQKFIGEQSQPNDFDKEYLFALKESSEIVNNIQQTTEIKQKIQIFNKFRKLEERLELYQTHPNLSLAERRSIELLIKNIIKTKTEIKQKDQNITKFLKQQRINKDEIVETQSEFVIQKLKSEGFKKVIPDQNVTNQEVKEQNLLCCRPSFVYGEKLIEDEDMTIKYKNFKWPFEDKDLKFVLKKEICSYLNSQGGSIFIGVRDQDHMVVGLDLVQDERKAMEKLFYEEICKDFDPPIRLEQKELSVTFIPVKMQKKNGTWEWMKRRWVPKIYVKQGSELSNLYTFAHGKENINCFIRIPGECQQFKAQGFKQKMEERVNIPNKQVPQHICKEVDQQGKKECMDDNQISQLEKSLSNQKMLKKVKQVEVKEEDNQEEEKKQNNREKGKNIHQATQQQSTNTQQDEDQQQPKQFRKKSQEIQEADFHDVLDTNQKRQKKLSGDKSSSKKSSRRESRDSFEIDFEGEKDSIIEKKQEFNTQDNDDDDQQQQYTITFTDVPQDQVDTVQDYIGQTIFRKSFQNIVKQINFSFSSLVYHFEDRDIVKQALKELQMQQSQISQKLFTFKKIYYQKNQIYPTLQSEEFLFLIKDFDFFSSEKFRQYLLQFLNDEQIDFQCFLGYNSIICICFQSQFQMDNCINKLGTKYHEISNQFNYKGKLTPVIHPQNILELGGIKSDKWGDLEKFLKKLLQWQQFSLKLINKSKGYLVFKSLSDAIASYDLMFYYFMNCRQEFEQFGKFKCEFKVKGK